MSEFDLVDGGTPPEEFRASSSACPRCQERGKFWHGSDPRCAFPNGLFEPDNWSCATAGALREAVDPCGPYSWWCEDQYFAIIPFDDPDDPGDLRFIFLSWYKSRGRTETAELLTSSGAEPLDLKRAEEALRWLAARPAERGRDDAP